MILDARIHHHPKHRPFTVFGALMTVIEPMEVGSSIIIENVIDHDGDGVYSRLWRSTLTKTKNLCGYVIITKLTIKGVIVRRLA